MSYHLVIGRCQPLDREPAQLSASGSPDRSHLDVPGALADVCHLTLPTRCCAAALAVPIESVPNPDVKTRSASGPIDLTEARVRTGAGVNRMISYLILGNC